jgi:hypothetical protein
VDITRPYEPPSVDHGVAVIATVKGVTLAGVTTIFPDLTCYIFNHGATLASLQS